MAKIHIFLDDDEVRKAVHQYLTSRNVEVAFEDIYFIEESSGEQISVEVEAMNVTLTDLYTGL